MEEVWQHALQFLDKYRLDNEENDIDHLYQFNDTTGLLEDHRNALASLSRDQQINIKILYAELIQMLINEDKQLAHDKTKYDAVRSITKINGYQELTNQMQMFLNKQFVIDISKLKLFKDNDQVELDNNETIIQRLDKLEQTCCELKRENSELRLANDRNVKRFRQQSDEHLTSDSRLKDEHFKWQKIITNYDDNYSEDKRSKESYIKSDTSYPFNKDIERLEGKMSTIINQANTLLINDAQHTSKIAALEIKAEDFIKKVSDLESADLYLQQATQIAAQKSEQIENMLTHSKDEQKKIVTFEDHKQIKVKDETKTFEGVELNKDKLFHSQSMQENIDCINNKINLLQEKLSVQNNEIKSDTKHSAEVIGNQNNEDILQKVKFLEEQVSSKHETTISKEYFHSQIERSEKVESTTVQTEQVDRDTKTKVQHIRKIISLMLTQDTATTLQLLQMQRVMIDLQDTRNVYQFIEMVGGLDRSLNQVVEDLILWRDKVDVLSGQKKEIVSLMRDQQQILDEQKNDIDQVVDDLEQVKKQEMKYFELVDDKIKAMESLLSSFKMERRRGEKKGKARRRKHYGSEASIKQEELQTLLETPRPSGWLSSLFNKNDGSSSLCC